MPETQSATKTQAQAHAESRGKHNAMWLLSAGAGASDRLHRAGDDTLSLDGQQTAQKVRGAARPEQRMNRVQIAHTGHLDRAELHAARALLDAVFDDMSDDDWDHEVGGIHALVWEADELVAHASVVQRRLLHVGAALRAGYVEAVAVRTDRRRQGYGGAMMVELERIIRSAYDLGALGASDDGLPFYLRRGWLRWRGPTSALTPDGIVRTPEEDGSVLVLPTTAPLDIGAELTCDWRGGCVW